jgi:hypothetical protein
MITLYLNCTANLGDFVQVLPVISGFVKKYGKVNFVIRHDMKKFKGLVEFLKYQDLFETVCFDDEATEYGSKLLPVYIVSSWTREDKGDVNRPIETCRYENWLKDHYQFEFDVDDDFVIKFPKCNVPVDMDAIYVGDRWNHQGIDDRRETGVLSHLNNCKFLDYNNDLLTNCYIISTSPKPFITNFTGIGMIADLLNKECLVVWKAEDWKPEYRVGDNISWDNGKDINKIFEKHFYLNRKAKLVHASELDLSKL